VKEEKMSIFPTKVLLATDDSDEAALATQTAVDLADKTGSELHVVLVGLSAAYVGMGPPEIADIPAPRQEELTEEARRLLEAQVRHIEADGGTVAQAHLRIGKPDEQIVALAEEIGAGLIVMGSRGLGAIRRALMGSVSASVVRHAHCPVLIVRAEKRGGRYLEGSVSTARRPRREGAEGESDPSEGSLH
jgi:nucleotide-binding universal stress UspA family protein